MSAQAGGRGSEVLVFDMDGVLVDVSDSYREAIIRTVEDFAGVTVSREQVQDYKTQGGWNNDWALSQKILSGLGMEVDYETVVRRFNEIFLGNGGDGLIRRERWIAHPGMLERLGESYRLAIFTGRMDYELAPTLSRFAPDLRFHPMITASDVENAKPAPDGLLLIASVLPEAKLWYIGDTVDDARSARAAGVSFIGIASAGSPRYCELRDLLAAEGALAVLDDINQLETVLAHR